MKNSYEPKISVIIPVYNAEKYVKTAIQSILKQNFFDFDRKKMSAAIAIVQGSA